MLQIREGSTLNLNETYTKVITLYLNKYCKTYSILKNNDIGVDSNRYNYDKYNFKDVDVLKV